MLPALTVITPIIVPVAMLFLIISAIKIDKARAEKTLLMIHKFSQDGLSISAIKKKIQKDLLNREKIQNALNVIKYNFYGHAQGTPMSKRTQLNNNQQIPQQYSENNQNQQGKL